jgi:NAD(P)-dependent dehydrogenase (short-subunit alcohol dehydrogenase family)
LESIFSRELKIYPGKLLTADLHLEKSSEFAQLAAQIEQRHSGRLDVLINNAGYGLLGVLEDQTEQQLRHQMEVNFFGTALLTQTLLPALRKARGRVLNVSSIAGLSSFPFYGSYSASKFALEGLMQGLAFDVSPFGVQVGMIEPGGFHTDFVTARKLGERSEDPSSPYYPRMQAFLNLFKKTSSSRQDDPIRVARLISKLCDSRKVPFQNVIGKDAQAARLLKSLLPTGLYRRVIGSVFETGLSRSQ